MEATYQQMVEQEQAARDEARAVGAAHAGELRQLRSAVAARDAKLAQLTAAEANWRRQHEELMNQVGVVQRAFGMALHDDVSSAFHWHDMLSRQHPKPQPQVACCGQGFFCLSR